MKIFIITEGDRNIGFGHITRCISLYQAFEETGAMPQFIVNGDECIEDLLKNKNYEIFNWIEERSKLFELVKNADVLIVDSYLADISFYKNLSNLVRVPVYIDDNKRLNYPRGIVVNGSVYAEELDYPRKDGIVYLLGTKYIPLRKEFWEVPEKKIKGKVESIIITFGGDDMRNMTPKILRFLRENCPNLRKNVIIGKAFQNIDGIKKEADKNTNLIYYPGAEKMKEVMLASDIAISASGQTLYELARVGVPTIGICVVENQLGNLKGLERAGSLDYAGWYEKSNLIEKLKNLVKYLDDVNVRKSKSTVGRELTDGKGSLRIVKSLSFNWFKNKLFLRKATFEDALDIFNLSNEDVVRRNSFSPKKIEWEHHFEWLKEKSEDKNCVFFVVVDDLNKFYGQIRFDINSKNKKAIINIGLAQGVRGLGLCSFIIDKSVDALLKIKNVNLIKAYIKEENIPSIRSFEKANFIFLENLIIKGNKSKLYIKEV